jgi:hypothetical protein
MEQEVLERFFLATFGQEEGFVCIAFLDQQRNFDELYFRWPSEFNSMCEAIEDRKRSHNVYFCPQLLTTRKRNRATVSTTTCAWADLDACPPESMIVRPTIVIESSPGRFQALWRFDSHVDPDDAEEVSRRIAYFHAEEGADKSGWDLSQLLRVPGTKNFKYKLGLDTPTVKILRIGRDLYRLKDFDDYPAIDSFRFVNIPLPPPEAIQGLVPEELLQAKRLRINPSIWRLFTEEPIGDWSKVLWNLEMLLFEASYTREEVFVIAQEAKCYMLWKDVCRAAEKNDRNTRLLTGGPDVDRPIELLSEEERTTAQNYEETFIERYQRWARSLGDAAPQYHQAGAFVALSALLAGAVKLPTSFGTVVPNLWFMILADTTLTRKSTAMDLSMDLTTEVESDILLATDGSIEGLMTALGTRPNRPSVFLRDEVSGLIEAMTKKDYYAGMPEILTKLYDGKMQKRILRKEIIEVRDPILIFFAGGIKTKVLSLLTYEQVSSGFMPRFVFITAESDPTKLKPIGPPTIAIRSERDVIRAELQELKDHYTGTTYSDITLPNGQTAKLEVPLKFEAELTDDAWVRYNAMESLMVENGLKSSAPDMMTPTYDRLAKSILKAAVLLSASRQRGYKVIVEEKDLLRAMLYGEQWIGYAKDVMANVGKNGNERLLDNIANKIKRDPGVSRSTIMQHFHLGARDATQLFDTLEQRGKIVRQKAGRTEQLYPTTV